MKKFMRQVGGKISGTFLRGLAITLPLILTAALLYWLVALAEDSLGGLIRYFFPGVEYWPGLGTLVAIAFIFAAGALMHVWFTRRLMLMIDGLLERIPLVKSIYGGLRDVATLLSKKDSKSGFRKVVAVRFGDMRLIGFVTVEDFPGLASGSSQKHGGQDATSVGVYLPMSYQIGGFTVFVPRSSVEPMEMSVEDAMRFTLTAGVSKGKEQPA